ncbi:MAG: tetratricopeptide repeat protein [Balneolaceae bacterium]
MTLLILLITLWSLPEAEDPQKANEAFNQGRYAEAATLYKQAIESDPDNARLHFNLGNALANAGESEEAIRAFEQFKSMTSEPENHALADYNIGRVLADQEELEQAAEQFRRSLRNSPEDEDARHNYELARQILQQQDQEQQQQDQDGDGEEDEEQEQQSDDSNDESENEQEPDDGESESGQDEQPPSGDPQTDGDQQPEPQMSLEEAESVLEALEQRERELLRDRRKESDEEPGRDERDW